MALSMRNNVDAKHSRDGDHIYLETARPVSTSGWVVIPAGSFVNGTIQLAAPAGKSKGTELSVRFDTLILPNGVTRDLRSGAVLSPVTLSKRLDVMLRQGTSLDMTLDKDLRFTNEELHRPTRY
jgi:hypothetical protein